MRIAVQRLDGLGGTATVTDQVKKIYDITGMPVTLVIRRYKELFLNNPYVEDVIEVGDKYFKSVTDKYSKQFDIYCDIRCVVGKWYFSIPDISVDFTKWQVLYDRHPTHRDKYCKEANDVDLLGLNQIQIVDMSLGLPYDTMDVKLYTDYKIDLPYRFVVVAAGADEVHKGKELTKQWYGWDTLVSLMPKRVVQVGTSYDPYISGAYDYRGKTSIPELIYVLKKADCVICIEGGIMHLAYAVGAKTIVLRGPTASDVYRYPNQVCIDSYPCKNCWGTEIDWFKKCPLSLNKVCMQSITPERVLNAYYEVD